MLSVFCKRFFLLAGMGLLCFCVAYSQEPDSLTIRQLTDVEVIEKVRPSVTRQSVPVQRLEKDRIEQLGLQELSEAVRRFSGVTIRDYGGIGGLKTVSVRSLGSHHTGVSYDGITVTDAQSGQVDISRFSLDNVESVSLVMGQGDDIFQTARMFASAGMLSIQTERPDFTEKNFSLKGAIDAGSFGYFKPSVQYGQKLNETHTVTFHADWMRADGHYPYKTTYENLFMEGKRINSDIKSLHSELNIFSDWDLGGRLHLKGYWFDSERGLPGNLTYREDYSTERLKNKNGFVQAVYDNSTLEKFSFKASAKIDYNKINYQDFHSGYKDGVQTDLYHQREYYGSVAFKYTPSPFVTITLAEDFFVNTLEATTSAAYDPSRSTSLTALAASYMNSRITVTGSLLNTFIRDKTTGSIENRTDRKRLSPSVSVSYRLIESQNLRVRASYKDAFRTPTFSDLYYDRVGIKSLKPEKAQQYNVGLTWSGEVHPLRLDYLSFSVDGYYNRIDDKIIGFPMMFVWQMVNAGKVDIKGIDVNLSSRFTLSQNMFLGIDVNYSWQDAIDVTDKNSKIYKHQIPYTPVHSGNISVSWENPWVNVSWLATMMGERYALQQNIEANRMKGYVEQQVSLSRDFRLNKCLLKLHTEVLNIGDVSHDIIRFYPMPGRSFRAGIKIVY